MHGPLTQDSLSSLFMMPTDRIGTEIAALLKMAFEAIWTPPGRLLASILDQFGLHLGAPGAVGD